MGNTGNPPAEQWNINSRKRIHHNHQNINVWLRAGPHQQIHDIHSQQRCHFLPSHCTPHHDPLTLSAALNQECVDSISFNGHHLQCMERTEKIYPPLHSATICVERERYRERVREMREISKRKTLPFSSHQLPVCNVPYYAHPFIPSIASPALTDSLVARKKQ